MNFQRHCTGLYEAQQDSAIDAVLRGVADMTGTRQANWTLSSVVIADEHTSQEQRFAAKCFESSTDHTVLVLVAAVNRSGPMRCSLLLNLPMEAVVIKES